ncbi:hypothetical protein SV7mr_19940 [Stieleria bergensis]|uniref:Uncharacterized protein n=1 Tax=Stieleria bergensis TaxID=2528025 RepID=A0A517STN8_9BACT|nr:hypothetical protein SV7mr_19940 [Planctomycetes bacterium SV_7m_r]
MEEREDGWKTRAWLYRHHNGHPDDVMTELDQALKRAWKRVGRIDSEMLAAAMIAESIDDDGVPQLVPCHVRHGDLEFRNEVRLDQRGPASIECCETGDRHEFFLN